MRSVDGVPPGESVEVMTYFLGSRALETALARAFARGVQVRVVVEASTVREHPESVRLHRLLAADRTDASWVRLARGSTRGPGGAMHQKTWRFSRVGNTPYVTVTGSYNAGDLADSRAHALMWQWVGADVYRAFAGIWSAQVRMADRHRPLRTYAGPGWTAYFSPLSSQAPAGDPVLRRLAAIPARPGTVIRVAMYSMWGERGDRIAARLATMARRGARIVLLAGPTVSYDVRGILRGGGVAVAPGCFTDGTYTHSKDMSATYVAGGRRQYWTWVGSDNWTTDGTASDEAVLGIESRAMHEAFRAYAERLRTRPGGVFESACHPRGGE
ncbi:hypothetical protein G5V59_04265 [Nocardioides sp. W3-2-3]|uniref:phospholipase D-like domain-containing protein n=1 Tax=Nocardioides convexus TaxID=2712224 RepID=UPI0024185B71|nr:phospholipase D-like domain-containing protein [Nocardioides convexus]NGZ99803.1 hypothetical protein [Nocardioides convexus]